MDSGSFQDRARLAVIQARQNASRRGHATVTPVHLLAALASDADGIAAFLLERCGISPGWLATGLGRLLDQWPRTDVLAVDIRFSPDLQRALDSLTASSPVGGLSTGHLLVGLIASALADCLASRGTWFQYPSPAIAEAFQSSLNESA